MSYLNMSRHTLGHSFPGITQAANGLLQRRGLPGFVRVGSQHAAYRSLVSCLPKNVCLLSTRKEQAPA